MTNISFVPSICILRSIILIFIEKKSMLVDYFPPRKIYFSAIFNFHFCKNPHFHNESQALPSISGPWTTRAGTCVCHSRIRCLTIEPSRMFSAHNHHANNNNNNCIQRHNSRFFTISSLRCKPSPTRTLKWPGRNSVQITCNTSSAYHVKNDVLCATWYEGAAQLLSVTEFKSHLF